ncbi:MAG: 1-acyl-sn-glycerol-3-phosphate acyltransferase [Planctomycetes bacterium]|nr:1-acyl-sn-glycerol-3-phosphate acyltransferase [Planctomycetota bacterium]
MQWLRPPVRISRACAATAWWYALWWGGRLALCVAPRARQRWRRWIMRRWCRALCAAFAVRVEVVGTPPPPSALLVANHLGYLDILVLGSQVDAAFVSRADIARWPLIGPLARDFDTLFLVRERRRDLPAMNSQIAHTLGRGIGLVIFPEGTSHRGDTVHEFRPSLLAPAAEAGLAVWAACLSYRTAPGDPPASTHVCWWGNAPFGPHARALLRLRRIDARIEFLPRPERHSDRKQLAVRLRAAVLERFVPVA